MQTCVRTDSRARRVRGRTRLARSCARARQQHSVGELIQSAFALHDRLRFQACLIACADYMTRTAAENAARVRVCERDRERKKELES